MRMLAIVADLQREPADLGEMPPVPPHESADLLTLVTGTVGSMAGRTAHVARLGAGATIPAWIRYARPLGLRTRRPRHGAFRLPDGRAESQHLVTRHAGSGDDPSARHDRGLPGRAEEVGQDRRRNRQRRLPGGHCRRAAHVPRAAWRRRRLAAGPDADQPARREGPQLGQPDHPAAADRARRGRPTRAPGCARCTAWPGRRARSLRSR
jgi:hypothetical protein